MNVLMFSRIPTFQSFYTMFCVLACDVIHMGKCYVRIDEFKTWWDALDYCRLEGGGLAEICDSDLNEQLEPIANTTGEYQFYMLST